MELEETLPDVPVALKEITKSNLIPVAVGVLVLGAGIGIGIRYILKRRNKYEVITLADVRPPRVVISEEDHPAFNKDVSEVVTPMSVVRTSDPQEVVVTVNEEIIAKAKLFASTETDMDHWDYDEEIKKRNPLAPYVLHKDEFFAEEMSTENYLQLTYTYYAGDDILVDEDDKPIYNKDAVVGELKFGHGSGDPNCVYVRNMTRDCEYEVLYDPGLYSIEVLGLEMENNERALDLKHSKERKFRPE